MTLINLVLYANKQSIEKLLKIIKWKLKMEIWNIPKLEINEFSKKNPIKNLKEFDTD